MKEVSLILSARDSLLLRDGRPFDAQPGARARSLEWPLPRTIAGALRTAIGRDLGFDWAGDGPASARKIALRGALPLRLARGGCSVCVPRPADALFVALPDDDKSAGDGKRADSAVKCLSLRPHEPGFAGGVAGLPEGMRPIKVTTGEKPAKDVHLYWTLDSAIEWLSTRDIANFTPDTMAAPKRDVRMHVTIDPKTGAAEEGNLFATEMRAFGERFLDCPGQAILCSIALSDDWSAKRRFITMGGERRLAIVEPADADGPRWPRADDYPQLLEELIGASRLRLQLATPALFEGGWKPGWLGDGLCGKPPGLPGVRLRLVSVASARPQAVSGWNLEEKKPMPARLAAAAGSVYFFEVADGEVTRDWAKAAFLAPVSDREVDRNDGSGVALFGVW